MDVRWRRLFVNDSLLMIPVSVFIIHCYCESSGLDEIVLCSLAIIQSGHAHVNYHQLWPITGRQLFDGEENTEESRE